MRQFINILSGFFLGLTPLLGAALLSLAIYAAFRNTTALVIMALLGVVAVWIGLQIFKGVQRRGPIHFMAAVHASPDLDHLELTAHSLTKKRSPETLVELINSQRNLCPGGSMCLFGDWFGEPHKRKLPLQSAAFSAEHKLLTLHFAAGEVVEIQNPRGLFESDTFLKILKADRVRLSWPANNHPAETHVTAYHWSPKRIKVESTVKDARHTFHVSLGEPALMLFA
jgi:hypothetical protein